MQLEEKSPNMHSDEFRQKIPELNQRKLGPKRALSIRNPVAHAERGMTRVSSDEGKGAPQIERAT